MLGHLKGGVAEAFAYRREKMKNIQRNEQDTAGGDNEIRTQLLILENALKATEEKKIVAVEVHAEQKEENRRDNLNIGGIACHTVVQNAEAAGSRRAEGDTERVEQGHSAEHEKNHVKQCQGNIDEIQDHGGFAHPGDDLPHVRSRAFRPEKMQGKSALAACREDRKKEHQHAHPAEPVGKAAPEKHSPRHGFHVRHHRRAGGGKARKPSRTGHPQNGGCIPKARRAGIRQCS